MFLHRCIPGFIVQGGGFAVPNPTDTNYFFQYSSVTNYSPVKNEYAVGRLISNTYGTIAMAKLGNNPDSATSQWFFNLGNNSANLDAQNGGFTVFGRVVAGTNVLNLFNGYLKATTNLYVGDHVEDLTWWYPGASLFSDLPVLYKGLSFPRYSDLNYVRISVLSAGIKPTVGGRQQIAWQSTSGKTNWVESTTNLPPAWKPLFSTNGTGLLMSFVDTNPAPSRFYRVRIDY